MYPAFLFLPSIFGPVYKFVIWARVNGVLSFIIQTLLRPCAMILPDFKPFIEVTLLCNGYQEYELWARKLTLFTKLVRMQV